MVCHRFSHAFRDCHLCLWVCVYATSVVVCRRTHFISAIVRNSSFGTELSIFFFFVRSFFRSFCRYSFFFGHRLLSLCYSFAVLRLAVSFDLCRRRIACDVTRNEEQIFLNRTIRPKNVPSTQIDAFNKKLSFLQDTQ